MTNHITTICLLILAIALGIALVVRNPGQAIQEQATQNEALEQGPTAPPSTSQASFELVTHASRYDATRIPFQQMQLGQAPRYSARITNVQVCDLNQDESPDVLVCDAGRNTILSYLPDGRGGWQEKVLVEPNRFSDPAHATVVDLDEDGDSDIVVSVLGNLYPDDARRGRVELLTNDGNMQFTPSVLLDDLRRVADVQAGDLDDDGDTDLVVAEFGFERGRILWMENVGAGQFKDHLMLTAPGTVHVPIADYDGDGDLDVAALVTQDEEEVWLFENLGEGFQYVKHRVFYTPNFDAGGAGLVKTDLDQDGDVDFLVCYGDNLDLIYHYPQPYHGCVWLENRGDLTFVPKRIGDLGGTYGASPADLDQDGDIDVVLSSMFNDWRTEGSASLVWLENDGKQNFTSWQIADAPSHLSTVACGDLNGDGRPDIVAGAMHTYEPFDRLGRLSLWLNQGGKGNDVDAQVGRKEQSP